MTGKISSGNKIFSETLFGNSNEPSNNEKLWFSIILAFVIFFVYLFINLFYGVYIYSGSHNISLITSVAFIVLTVILIRYFIDIDFKDMDF